MIGTTIFRKYLITFTLGLIFVALLLHARTQIQGIQEIDNKATPTNLPPESPVPLGTSTEALQVVDRDPVVNCGISSECGGGSRQMKQSKCNQMTCCLIHEKCGGGARFMTVTECKNLYCCFLNDGTSKLMTKSECDNYSNNQQDNRPTYTNPPSNTQVNKVPVFISYGGYTLYCPSQNVSAIQSINSTMESKKMEWAKNFNDCANTFYKTDSCFVSCKNTMDNDWKICTTVYGYEGANYSACTKEVSDNYGKCIPACPDVNKACEYVYWEQKNLSSQISDLCK